MSDIALKRPDNDAAERPGPAADSASEPPTMAHRITTLVAAAGLFWVIMEVFPAQSAAPITGVFVALGNIATLGVAVTAMAARTTRTLSRANHVLVTVAALGIICFTVAIIITGIPYGTDEEIFVQHSAHLLGQGTNPYGADLTPAFHRYAMSSQFYTKLLDGTYTHGLDYPAVPVLLTWAANSVFHDYHTVAFVCSGSLVAALLVAYKVLPKEYRGIATIICVGFPILMDHARGGVVGIIMLPFLIFAVVGWERIGLRGKLSRRDIISAACFGVALSVQQLSWMIAPFFVVAIFMTRFKDLGAKVALRVAATFSAIAVGVMLLINSPFIVWNPGSWIAGVTEPLRQKAIAEGEGLVDIPISLHFGTGNLGMYSLGGFGVYAAFLVVFVLYFDILRPAWIVLPSAALVFQGRPLIEYFAIPALVWAVALLTSDKTVERSPRPWPNLVPRRRQLYAGVAFLPALGFWTMGVTASQPLDLKIMAISNNGPLNQIDRITVQVHNTTGTPINPHFMMTNCYSTSFWNELSGPTELPGGKTETYVITTPGMGSSPSVGADYTLAAVASDPASVSYAPKSVSTKYTATFLDDLGRSYAAGDTAHVEIQLRDRHNRVVKVGGVRVQLNQVRFLTGGIKPSNLSLNGGASGESPAETVTDADGIAHFTVTKPTPDSTGLVYMQAWIVQSGSISTYGYSPFLTQQWP